MQPAKFVKLLLPSMEHNGMKFKEGLNVDNKIMTLEHCAPDGIYFTDTNNVCMWLKYYSNDKDDIIYPFWICDVEIPDGESFIAYEIKYKASKVILSNFRPIYRSEEEYKKVIDRDPNSKIIPGDDNSLFNPEVYPILYNSVLFTQSFYYEICTRKYIAKKDNNHVLIFDDSNY